MAIQQLQLPPLISVPTPDFSALSGIGTELRDLQQRSQAQDLIAGAFTNPAQASPSLVPPVQKVTSAPLPPAQPSSVGASSGVPLSDMASTDYSARTRLAENASGNPYAKNPNSSASGTYQFTDGTWIDNFNKTFPQAASMPDAQKLDYKNDPRYADVQKAVFNTFTNSNAQTLSAKGIPINNQTLYAAHFFGAGDAPKVLTADPNTPLAAIVSPASLAANPFLQNMTAGQARQWLAQKMAGGGSAGQAPQAATPQAPQAVPQGGVVPPAAPTNGLSPQLAQKIGLMLTNPYTAKLGQALLAKYVTPHNYQLVTDAAGVTRAVDPLNPRDNYIAFQGAAKPIAVPLGGSLVAPSAPPAASGTSGANNAPQGQGAPSGYHTIFQNRTGIFDQPTLTAMADQYLAGDKSVLQNLGRGNMAAINITALRERIVNRAKELGISPTETAARIGQFNSYVAAQKATGSRAGNVEMAAIEAGNLGNLVVDTSNAVPRGNFPLWNKVTNSYYENTGDPNIIKFTGALNSFINAYARAINPSGTSTVSDKDHAREILSTAMSHGQIDAGVKQLMAELEQVKKSPGTASKTLSDEFMTRANPTAPKPAQGARLQLPKGVSGASVVNDAKKVWAAATPEQRAAMKQKALAYGIDLTKYGLQ